MSATTPQWVQGRFWMVASLVIVCLVAAFSLARVYNATRPVIEQQRIEATNRALAEVLPRATRFEEQVPDTLWYGFDGADEQVGSVIKVSSRGYAGPIEALAGIGQDGRITGIYITSLKETPGLGLKATEPRFRDRFLNRTPEELRLVQDGGSIDAISAATITSRAIADGIREGIESLRHRLPIGAGKSDPPDELDFSDPARPDQP